MDDEQTCKFTSSGLSPAHNKLPSDHEYIWERVQRERKEGNDKYKGGRRAIVTNYNLPPFQKLHEIFVKN